MDLLFKRYASPYFLLDEYINLGRLHDFVYSFAEIVNESKMWDIYLALVANPYAEVSSFEEFKEKHKPQKKVVDKSKVEATINDSFAMLNSFNP